ncbi:MAG: site-specific integrase [Terrimicrobiaceae bacterium]|nr:site-specific integrase [Terrimicrobiaceae bacterium]
MKRNHRRDFIPAVDYRNRRIPGLYRRGERFYGLVWANCGSGRRESRRFRLTNPEGEPCSNVVEAKAALDVLRGKKAEDLLAIGGKRISFFEWADRYLELASTKAKRPGTVENERQAIDRWKSHLGDIALSNISTPHLAAFIEKRLQGGRFGRKDLAPASPRTVKLDCVMLSGILKTAVQAGYLGEVPRMPKFKTPPPPVRTLLTPEQFERLLVGCLALDSEGQPVSKNGEQLRDFLRFLAYSGAREKEALGVAWSHIDLQNERLFLGAHEEFQASGVVIGSGGLSKNHRSRIVDFNPQLKALLEEMKSRRAPDSKWLFPSPQRGDTDRPAKTFRESLRLVRKHAGLPNVGFHDLRHLFCSHCVMAGIDFMTIAAWLGHKDGGILIGKVYGHLLDEHRRKMAAKVVIG